jgi:membrane protease YdiL (CAAX protease family)
VTTDFDTSAEADLHMSPEPAGEEVARRLDARKAFAGLGVAIVAVVVASALLAIPFAIAGADLDGGGFVITGTIVQDLVVIAVAYFLAADLGAPNARTFGLRPFRSSAFGWIFAALAAYLVLTSIYTVLVDPPSEQLPSGLEDADQDLLLAIATGTLLIGVAPIAEEVFFRGFLYQAFRNSWGVLPGAVLSGLLFGAIHLEFFKLVQLAILGVILALLFEKTGSLWPPIILHGVNNTLAFIYLLSQ